MTYYEEFGIPSTASEGQIRQAHRTLIKLLHPDLHQDEVTRRLAEAQTCRLNLIIETLLDPQKRTEYDRTFTPVAHTAPPGKLRLPEWMALTAAFGLAAMILFSWIGTGLESSAETATAVLESPKPQQKTPPRGQVQTNAISKNNLLRPPPAKEVAVNEPPTTEPVARKQEDDKGSTIDIGNPIPAERVLPPPAPTTDTAAAEDVPIELRPNEDITGTWIYVPPPRLQGDKVYRPEYIELRIREINGQLDGEYRARYRITDRPLSPNVSFRFYGPSPVRSDNVQYQWKGMDGVEGVIRMSITRPNTLQTEWNATRGASAEDLISGNATLVRSKTARP